MKALPRFVEGQAAPGNIPAMFGSNDYRSNRSRGRSSFGGQRGRSTSTSRQDRRPPYAPQDSFDSRGSSWDTTGYNSRGGSRRYDDRRGSSGSRYRGAGNDWEEDSSRRHNYRGRGTYHYQPNGRGGSSYQSGERSRKKTQLH